MKSLLVSSMTSFVQEANIEGKLHHVSEGSWLCENAKIRDGDRRNYSSKTALTAKRASELNLPNDPKNVILAAFQSFAFLHSQGQ